MLALSHQPADRWHWAINMLTAASKFQGLVQGRQIISGDSAAMEVTVHATRLAGWKVTSLCFAHSKLAI
jgi:hypothetical protein